MRAKMIGFSAIRNGFLIIALITFGLDYLFRFDLIQRRILAIAGWSAVVFLLHRQAPGENHLPGE